MRGVASTIARYLLWIYLAYLALCLLILLPALNIGATWAVREFAQRELEHDIIVFNPFTLALHVREAAVYEADGHIPLHVEKAKVDLSLASLWREGIVFDALRVEQLDVHILRYADGSFHFDDLIPAEKEEPAPTSQAPGVTVEEIFISAHTLRFTDRTRPGPYSAAYSDFSVATNNITTLPGRRGDGGLTLRGADGGIVKWQGELAIAEGYSNGKVTLDGLDLTHLWRYEAERLPFVAESALLDIHVDYDVNFLGELSFTVSNGSVRLHDMLLLPNDAEALPDTQVAIGDLSITGIEADSTLSTVQIASVALSGLDLSGFDEGERISVLEMLVPPPVAGAETTGDPGTEADAAAAQEEEFPWQIAVGEAVLTNSEIAWRSPLLSPEVLSVTPLDARIEDITWPAQGESPLSLSLSLNDRSQLAVDGALHLGEGNGALDYRLGTLPLEWFNPLLNTVLRADIGGGLLTVSGGVQLAAFMPDTVNTDLLLQRLAVQIHGTEDAAALFEELAITGAVTDLGESSAQVEDIRLQGLRGTLHILENGNLNISSALVEPATADTVDAAGGEQGAPSSEGAEGATPWAVRVGHIGIREGQLDFSDASLPLPFQTLIGDIEADINDLDSSSGKPMVATLNGAVDGYAPVVIEASGTPLADPRDAQVTLNFRGMDIASMSPYSGTYAGYTIDSGTLTVDLRYRFEGTQIAGDNRIVISQMELGEPIESEKAMQLPLRLGLALLTDAQGVIDLAVPISGDVDDPEFSLGGVIAGAIANVIIKAATAPFRLLAGLVNSEQDLENVTFEAGSEALTQSGGESLAALATALSQRPKLQLRILGSTDPAVDRRALQSARLRQQIIDAGVPPGAVDGKLPAYQQAIDARYAALALPAAEDGSEPDISAKEEALRSRIELPPGTLQDLGTSRATAAKRELVNAGGIDAARIAVAYDKSLLIAGAKMSLDG